MGLTRMIVLHLPSTMPEPQGIVSQAIQLTVSAKTSIASNLPAMKDSMQEGLEVYD